MIPLNKPKHPKFYTPTDIITDYVLLKPDLYNYLVTANSDFKDEYNRYFSVNELSQVLKEVVNTNFAEYTDGEIPEHIAIKALIGNVNYHLIAMKIYAKLCNDTTELRQFAVVPTPTEFYNNAIEEYEKGMQAFFENKYLNF